MRRAAKVDANQAAIVKALRKIGCFVQPLHRVGEGCPDLLCAWRQQWYLMEVKRDAKASYTPDQLKWIAEVNGKAPIFRVESAIEAVHFMQAIQP